MSSLLFWLMVCVCCSAGFARLAAADAQQVSVEAPLVALQGMPFSLRLQSLRAGDFGYRIQQGDRLLARGRLVFDGRNSHAVVLRLPESGAVSLGVTLGAWAGTLEQRVLPKWFCLLPPLIAIVLAIVTRAVLVALGLGLWSGAWILAGGDPLSSVLRVFDTHLLDTILDGSHQSILVFSILLGGMTGLISRTGGGQGLAQAVTRMATDVRRGQLAAWGLGILLFFDDYASTLITGSSFRSIVDRLKISREKLAFLADATSAPIASLALASSWIGVEVGYISDQLNALGIDEDGYGAFLRSLPYRFYPWLMLGFVAMVALQGRDFGPMWKAERAARLGLSRARDGQEDDVDGSAGAQPEATHWSNALLPVLLTLVVVLALMIHDGLAALGDQPVTFGALMSNASASRALIWGAGAGGLLALLLALRAGTGTGLALRAWTHGVRTVAVAMGVLMLAWALGGVCRDLQTAAYLVELMGGSVSGALVPAVVFVVAALTSFATGSSWGTMGLVFPIAMPLAHELGLGDTDIMLSTIASILSGSVWGDHCSPISDTTIMSSMASGCDHVSHVRTQLPYALVVGITALLLGDVACGLGLYSPWVGLLLGFGVLWMALRLLGRPNDPPVAA